MNDQPNAVDIVNYLRLVVEPGMVVELRVLGVVDDPRYPKFAVSGYFDHDHLNELARAAIEWTKKAEGCYVTINPVDTALLARAANRVLRKPKNTTGDPEVSRRTGLVFDFDPTRPAGVSATDAEKALALSRMSTLVTTLTTSGWPDPIMSDSGNGGHARYRIDLPNDDASRDLVKRVLEAADALFSDDLVKVDTSMSNASRIVKAPGTLARKGDSTPDRPHRLSKILWVPTHFQIVPVGRLEAFANEHQPAPKPAASNGPSRGTGFQKTAKNGASPETRARAYVFSPGFPDSIAGEKGHDRLYHVACCLVDGFGLSRAEALPILGDWNQAKAKPPESEQQVVHKIDSAIKNHPVPSLNLLNTNGRSGKSPTARVPEDEPPIPTPLWPAAPGSDAYHGLAGEIVRVIEPHTEADPVALLVQLLIAFGSIIGRAAHASVGAARHYCNEFALLVGETSSARKGSSWSEVLNVIGGIDPDWIYRTGLSSGEGLIYHVRDPVIGKEPIKDKGKIIGYQDVTTDHGVDDKRLLVVETEFGGVLRVLAREGNKLSAVVRQAWDGGKLATMTKSFPYRATDAHVSLIGHITADELTKLLTSCDQANGFANRMLWVCCRRSKLLPFGGRVPDPELDRIRVSLSEAVAFAKAVGWIQWTPEAMELWREIYPRLTAPRPGVLGMVTSRAEAHTLRLATSHALMNRSWTITLDHLLAALALWNYCERSAAYIFGDRLGDKDAEAILEALRAAHGGMTRTEIRRSVFGDNKTADLVASKMGILRQHGLARSESITTNGRPAERWFPAKCDVKNVLNVESPAGVMPTPDPHHVKHVNHVPRGTENGSSEGTPPPAGREVFEI